MADAAGLALGEIQAIDYSWGEVYFQSEFIDCCGEPEMLAKPLGEMNIVADDIEASDTVTVLWEIKML